MAINYKSPEDIKKQVRTLFQSDFATHLATVEAYWTALGDTITLEDFLVHWIADTSDIRLIPQYPALVIASGDMTQRAGPRAQFQSTYAGEYQLPIGCRMFLQGIDPEQVTKKIDRYGQAALQLLNENPRLGGTVNRRIGNIVITPTPVLSPGRGNTRFRKAMQVGFTCTFHAKQAG